LGAAPIFAVVNTYSRNFSEINETKNEMPNSVKIHLPISMMIPYRKKNPNRHEAGRGHTHNRKGTG